MSHSFQVTLLLAGDIYAGDQTAHVSQEIRTLAAEADMVLVNLEGPLTDTGTPLTGKSTHLRNSPANIKILRELQTAVACLANNHMCDLGPEGVAQTRKTLGENNIAPVGAGSNRTEAEASVIRRRKGLNVGFLAFGAPSIQTVPAGADACGCAVLDEPRMLRAVRELRETADAVVVAVHWGLTNYHYPLPEHVTLGRALIDSGATLVVGHHPHVLQGYERYRQGAILYSLGNFVFTSYTRGGRSIQPGQENRLGVLAQVGLSADGVELIRTVHTRQVDQAGTVEQLHGRPAARRERFLRRLCAPLARPDYADFFRWYVLRRTVWRTLRWLNPRLWRTISRGHLEGFSVAVRRIFCPRP